MGQAVRFSTAGDWMEGYKCVFEMKSWPIDVKVTWKMGAIPAARLYYTKYKLHPPPGLEQASLVLIRLGPKSLGAETFCY